MFRAKEARPKPPSDNLFTVLYMRNAYNRCVVWKSRFEMEERYELFQARKASVGRDGHQGGPPRGRHEGAAAGDY